MSDHREMPQATEAERALLGACFLDGSVPARVALEDDDFFSLNHRAIWQALTAVEGPIDPVTVEERLRAADKLEAVGGLAYLSELAIAVPTADNAEHYARIIRDKRLAREVLLTLGEILGEMRQHDMGGADAVLLALERLGAIRAGGRARVVTVGAAADKATARILADTALREKGHRSPPRIPTGLLTLDAKMGGGYGRGTWTVIAARPGGKKTSYIMQTCRRAPVPALVFLYEEVDDIIHRELAVKTGIPAVDIAGQRLTGKQMSECRMAARLMRTDLHIVDARGMSARDISREARSLVREHKIELLAIDYLNRMRHPKADRYDLSIRATLDTLDNLVGDLKIPGLLGCQLSRAVVKEGRLPRIDDARDAGAIEEICKLGICLHSPYENRKPSDGGDDEVWMILDKQNLGKRRQIIKCNWHGPTFTIGDRVEDSSQEEMGDGDAPF